MISAGSTIRPCARDIAAKPGKNASIIRTAHRRRLFIGTCFCISECWRRVDPHQPSLRPSWISPAVRSRTLEVQAVARLQMIMLLAVEPDLKSSAKHVQEFLAFVRIGFAAAPAGFDAE